MNRIGHRTHKSLELLRDRSHSSKKYSYTRFLNTILPKIQEIEAKSPAMEFFYVFVHEGRKDYYDIWGRTDVILERLEMYAERADMSLNSLFSEVYVYTHSSNAYPELIDKLRSDGYTDLSEGMENMNVQLRKGEEKYKLSLFNTLQYPERHEALLHPRKTAKRAVAHLRTPKTAATIARKTAKSRGFSKEAANIIANTTRYEAIRNRAKTARVARNTIRKTVRNIPRLPTNIVRGAIAPFLTGRTPGPEVNRQPRTSNIQSVHLGRLFGKNE